MDALANVWKYIEWREGGRHLVIRTASEGHKNRFRVEW